ncbi:MAG: AEC family transporter [Candidatus Moranbacteria bacterium]|nr:AEC family transporter [Candidatus Moranbacteria bacterium]
MIEILITILPLFLIIFASAIIERFTHIGETWSPTLNEFALRVGFPVLIFSSLVQHPFSLFQQWPLIVSNSLLILSGFVLAFLLGKILHLSPQNFRTFFICIVFGNVAYLGIPIIVQTLGEQALPSTGLVIATYLFWLFTLGIGYLEHSLKKDTSTITRDIFKNLLKNPLLIAVVLGVILSGMSVSLPPLFVETLTIVKASVTPLILIVIGLFIGKSHIGNIREWIPVAGFSFLTLFLLPGFFFVSLLFLGFSPKDFSISIIEAGMPLAVTAFALVDQYKLNKIFIARTVVLSTIFSIFSLAFWIALLS